jgi:hypothetical protein
MNFSKYLLSLLVLFSFSCGNQKVLKEDVQTISLTESADVLPISSFISGLDYLELKASEANVEIGEILDIKVFGSDIIIKQRKAAEISFIRFSKDGEFINEIVNNKKGKVLNPRDVILYQKDYAVLGDDGIHVVSKTGKYKGKIISSDMSGGTFFASKSSFILLNDTPEEGFLREYSEKTKRARITKPDERIEKWIYTDLATPSKETIHLVSSFSDTIFSYSNSELVPKYKLDGGEHKTFGQVWQNVGERDSKETLRYIYDTQHILVRNFLENENIIFMTYWVGSNSTTLIIKKKDWDTRYYARAVNDIDGGIWDKALYLSDKDELYVPIGAYKIAGHKISNKWHQEFEKLQLHIAVTGNPVIMRCKLE